MENKNKTAPENQEQLNKYYPINLEFVVPIEAVSTFNNHKIIRSEKAVCVTVKIDSSEYDKDKIYKNINLICQQLLEYFR